MSEGELHGLLLTRNARFSEPTALSPAKRVHKKKQSRQRRAKRTRYSVTRRTVASFRNKLILLDAQEMCLCGLLSIKHSVHLIVCIEIFFALVLLIQSPDLLTMDGTYFYFLGLFDGGGIFFFTLHVSLCVTCLITSGILYLGSRKQMAGLILPHLFWQLLFIIVSLASICVLMTLGIKGKMLLPSSIVLSCMMGSAGACEVWWCILSLTYYRHIKNSKLQIIWNENSERNGIV